MESDNMDVKGMKKMLEDGITIVDDTMNPFGYTKIHCYKPTLSHSLTDEKHQRASKTHCLNQNVPVFQLLRLTLEVNKKLLLILYINKNFTARDNDH